MSTTARKRRPAGNQPRASVTRATKAASRGSPVAAWVAALVAMAVVVAGIGWYVSWRHDARSQLAGPLLRDSPPAADFALRDQDGHTVRMASLRGRVVALTFLYTKCPDACPLIAAKLARGWGQLGADQRDLTILAASVDPANDTPDAAKAFDATFGLGPPSWHYLVGNVQELAPVWRSYHVTAGVAGQVTGASDGGSGVDHTGIVYLIDRRQRIRIALDVNFQPQDFVHDVHVLAQS